MNFLLMIIGMMALFSIQYSPEMVKSGQITTLVTSSSKYTIEYKRYITEIDFDSDTYHMIDGPGYWTTDNIRLTRWANCTVQQQHSSIPTKRNLGPYLPSLPLLNEYELSARSYHPQQVNDPVFRDGTTRKQPIVTFLGWEPFETTGDDQEDLNGLNDASPVQKNTGPVKEENDDIGKTPCDRKTTSFSDSVVDRTGAIKSSPLKDGNLNNGKVVDGIPENNKRPEKIQDNDESCVKGKPVLNVNKKESSVGRAKLQETKQPKKEMSAKKKEGKEPADWKNKYHHGREIPQIRPFEDGYHTDNLDELLYNPETRWKILLILFLGFVAVFGITGAVFLPDILKGILVIYEKAKKRKTLRKTRRSKKQRRRPKVAKGQEPKANQLEMSKGIRSDSSNNLIHTEAGRYVERDRPIPQARRPIRLFGFFPRVLFPWRYLVQFSCPFCPHYAGEFYY